MEFSRSQVHTCTMDYKSNQTKIDCKLFTPGPVQTSPTVKQAMLADSLIGEPGFMRRFSYICNSITDIADQTKSGRYGTVVLPGSGTYAMECVFVNVIGNSKNKALILSNGVFGDRMLNICKQAGFAYEYLSFPENESLPCDEIEEHLKKRDSREYSLIAFVHSESSTGVVNPLDEIGRLAKRYSNAYVFVDAMSSFGAFPIKMESGLFDFVVTSANKCLQSVPGIAFVICNIEALKSCSNTCTSVSLDLNGHWNAQQNKMTRFTAPTHCILALEQAIIEFSAEGDVECRAERYKRNRDVLRNGMKRLGFKQMLNEQRHAGHVLTNYAYLNDPNFKFDQFFENLSQRGLLINPYYFSSYPSFRIGTMGHLFENDYKILLSNMEEVLKEMNVKLQNVEEN